MTVNLVFDTETTGKAFQDKSIKSPVQPSLVELAFVVTCSERGVVAKYSAIVNPEKKISQGAENVHGISQETAEKYGVPLKVAVGVFHFHMLKADVLVAHNMNFDLFVMQCCYLRVERSEKELIQKPTRCTMLEAMPILKIPTTNPRYKKKSPYKWPSLEEAYTFLVDSRGFTGAHRARNDVAATVKVMRRLDKRDEQESVPRSEQCINVNSIPDLDKALPK